MIAFAMWVEECTNQEFEAVEDRVLEMMIFLFGFMSHAEHGLGDYVGFGRNWKC